VILIIDNYDSFVFNVARYFEELGEAVKVVRNDAISAEQIKAKAIVISPGPCTPQEAGASLDIVRELSGKVPILGICLGHQVIGAAFGALVVRAKRPVRVPQVLSRDEVAAILRQIRGTSRLMASLIYGAGLRVLECARLRIKDIDLPRGELTVRDGKGGKDRRTVIPQRLVPALSAHLDRVHRRHEADLREGAGSVALPGALDRKYPTASREWGWQWVFRPHASMSIPVRERATAITCTSPRSSGRSKRRFGRQASPSPPPATPSGIASRRTSSKRATTFARSRSCWDTATSRPR